jgi:hypothetical protein
MTGARRPATPARLSASTQGIASLGPSDTSDSGSDVQGERGMVTAPDKPGEWGALPVDITTDGDAAGTGERGAASGHPAAPPARAARRSPAAALR